MMLYILMSLDGISNPSGRTTFEEWSFAMGQINNYPIIGVKRDWHKWREE